MFPYWVLFSVYAIGSLNGAHSERQPYKATPLFVAAGIFTAFFIGMRFEVGGDWFAYLATLETVSYQDFLTAMRLGDPGYMVLNWIVAASGADIWAVNLTCGLLCIWGLNTFAKSQPNPWLVVLVAAPYFIVVVAMGYTRQAVAISLILASLTALERRHIVRFALLFILAASFHKTAIVVLPLIGFAAARGRFAITAVTLVAAPILYVVLLQDSVESLITNYVGAAYESEGAAIRVAINLVPAVLFLLFPRRFASTELDIKLWRNFALAAIAMLVLLLLVPSSTAVDRIALYLIPLQLFILGRLPLAFPAKGQPNRELLLAVVCYSALIQFVWLNYAIHSEYWLPYQVYPLFI